MPGCGGAQSKPGEDDLVFIFSPLVSWNDFEFQFKDAPYGIFLNSIIQNRKFRQVKTSSRKRPSVSLR